MPDDPTDRPLAVSLRLKAARFLAGRRSEDGRAIAIPVPELAQHPLLIENRITRNRLEDYEQMTVGEPRPMELRIIAQALQVPPEFLLAGGGEGTPDAVLSELRELRSESSKRYAALDAIMRSLVARFEGEQRPIRSPEDAEAFLDWVQDPESSEPQSEDDEDRPALGNGGGQ